MNDLIDTFRVVIEASGLRPGDILADGLLHRCPVDGKPQGRDGAYVLHLDAPASGWWQNWRTGENCTWTAKEERTLSPAERQALQARIEVDRRARQEEEAKRQAEAADKARRIMTEATECTAHPYLERKGVKTCPGLKIGTDGRLVVPVLGEDGNPVSLQFIAEDGGKLFLAGGRTRGGYFAIKGDAGPLYIAEGLATGLSIREATGQTVFCAFNAVNLEHVAAHARQKYQDRELVLCADDDHATDGNPGLSKATSAAFAVGALLAVPSFKEPAGQTDFNDLHQTEGLHVVRAQLAGAVAPGNHCREHPKAWPMKSPLHVVNVADLLTMDLPERGYILYPVIPEQGLAMLYAPRGLGKTWAALSIAYAVASGQAVFGGWRSDTPRRVLYLDGEMPARTMKDRLTAIAAGSGIAPPEPGFLRLLTPDLQPGSMPNIATPEGQADLAPILEGVDLVVVDNIATLGRHGRENESESWTPVQGWLLCLRRAGKSVLLIHHSGKNGEQRGTSAREDILV